MTLSPSKLDAMEELDCLMIEADSTVLNDWEEGFIKDQLTRYKEYGAETRFSEKQWDIVDRIIGKLNATL